MSDNSSPVVRSLILLAGKGGEFHNRTTYMDYVYELARTGSSVPPMTEAQWEVMCSICGNYPPVYSSTVRAAIRNIAAEIADRNTLT